MWDMTGGLATVAKICAFESLSKSSVDAASRMHMYEENKSRFRAAVLSDWSWTVPSYVSNEFEIVEA